MNLIYAAGMAAIMAVGLYLLLSRHLVRMMYGVMLISAIVNLVIFLAGRIGSRPPPVMAAGETSLALDAANPLPQALVLTAIVIGFSLISFVAALALKTYRSIGTLDSRELGQAEALGSPFDEPDPSGGKKMPPRSPASRGPLPPEGAVFALGRPGDKKAPPQSTRTGRQP